MGISKSKSTSKSEPNAYAKPAIDAAQATLAPAYAAAQQNMTALMPRINSALDYSGDVMGGKYLNGNPHLQGVLDSTNRDVTTGVDSRFSSAGRYGSGMHAGVLARALAENENRIRYGNYETERGYQNQAPGQVAGLVGASMGMPQAAASTYADQVRALLGQYTNNTQTQSQPWGQMLLSGAASAANAYASNPAAFSDRRLKRHIEKIGELADGLGVYVWEYIWGKPAVGVMADEVAEKRPWALGPTIGGFASVNYGAL